MRRHNIGLHTKLVSFSFCQGPTTLHFSVTEQVDEGDAVILHGSFDRALPAKETLWLYAENGGWHTFVLSIRNGISKIGYPFVWSEVYFFMALTV